MMTSCVYRLLPWLILTIINGVTSIHNLKPQLITYHHLSHTEERAEIKHVQKYGQEGLLSLHFNVGSHLETERTQLNILVLGDSLGKEGSYARCPRVFLF
eukprot:scaffold2113_cov146-Skeletonema_menzelii.AAC.8